MLKASCEMLNLSSLWNIINIKEISMHKYSEKYAMAVVKKHIKKYLAMEDRDTPTLLKLKKMNDKYIVTSKIEYENVSSFKKIWIRRVSIQKLQGNTFASQKYLEIVEILNTMTKDDKLCFVNFQTNNYFYTLIIDLLELNVRYAYYSEPMPFSSSESTQIKID